MIKGGVAQLGERLICIQEVIGSIPFTSTIHLVETEKTAGYSKSFSFLNGNV